MVSNKKIEKLRRLVEFPGLKIKLHTTSGDFTGVIQSYHEGSAAELEPDPNTGQMWDSPEFPLKITFKTEDETREFGFRDIIDFTSIE